MEAEGIVAPAPPAASLELAHYTGAKLWKTAGSGAQHETLKANEVQQAKAARLSHRLSKQSGLQRRHQPATGRTVPVPSRPPLSSSRRTAAGLTETTGTVTPTAVSAVLDTVLLL